MIGGARGAALGPGDVEQSRLVHAVRYDDSDLRMPPRGKLDDDEIELLERWVAMGAPWTPGEEYVREHAARDGIDYEAGRQWWAFRPVALPLGPAVPAVPERLREQVLDPLDAFVLARLAAAEIAPNPRAPERELVRRAYFTLIGLPPTLAEVDAYVASEDPDKWPRLVDELLARPEYGQRWARHWLDLVRYAETNGFERDTDKPYAWRYRDWVVDALNADLGYDDFLVAQLAGDELPEADELPQGRIATGFYRLGPWDDEPADKEQAVFDGYDDIVRTIGEGMLGLGIACARCHDHKFDPVSQEDYYALLGFVRGVQPFQLPAFALDSPVLQPLSREPAEIEAWEADREAAIAGVNAELQALLDVGRERVRRSRRAALSPEEEAELVAFLTIPKEERTPAQKKRVAEHEKVGDVLAFQTLDSDEELLAKRLRVDAALMAESFEGELDWALVATEASAELPETRLLIRGQATSPGPVVEPAFPRVLCASDADAVPPAFEPSGTERGPDERPSPSPTPSAGARLALARWIASPENPLTARVIVNRVWQHHFGRGLVATPNDFGRAGAAPTHPELLDHLAARFVESGWSLKELHRTLMRSSTWQRDSRRLVAAGDRVGSAFERDPDNELLWRQRPRRLEAEALRDAILATSGGLVDTAAESGGPSCFPRLSRDALAGSSRPGAGWGVSSGAERGRRSLYVFIKRTLLLPFFSTFDYTTVSLPVGRRQQTNLASQHMALLNSEFANREAARFAQSLWREAPTLSERIARAFERALSRPASERELSLALEYVTELAAEVEARRDADPLTLVPRVPKRLGEDFLPLLTGDDLLFGPRDGWRYLKGRWGEPYNTTLELDADCAPIAVLQADPSATLTFRGALSWGPGCERLGLVFGLAERSDGTWHGVEVAIEPAHERVRVLWREPRERWRPDDEELHELARAPLPALDEAGALRLEIAYARGRLDRSHSGGRRAGARRGFVR